MRNSSMDVYHITSLSWLPWLITSMMELNTDSLPLAPISNPHSSPVHLLIPKPYKTVTIIRGKRSGYTGAICVASVDIIRSVILYSLMMPARSSFGFPLAMYTTGKQSWAAPQLAPITSSHPLSWQCHSARKQNIASILLSNGKASGLSLEKIWKMACVHKIFLNRWQHSSVLLICPVIPKWKSL